MYALVGPAITTIWTSIMQSHPYNSVKSKAYAIRHRAADQEFRCLRCLRQKWGRQIEAQSWLHPGQLLQSSTVMTHPRHMTHLPGGQIYGILLIYLLV